MLTTIALLALSLLMITAGAELLVRGSVGLARAAGVSSLLTGLTVVAFGTSAPELATSVRASLSGHTDIGVGNAVGSNIFNLGVILGLTALVCPIPVHRAVVSKSVVPMVGVAILPFAALATGNAITRPLGIGMLALLAVHLAMSYHQARRDPMRTPADLDAIPLTPRPARSAKRLLTHIALVIAGLALLVGATPLLVDNAVDIARALGVPELVIALTIVAGGTSAPELVTSVVAALRKEPDVAIGNVIGSNVFNILCILGVAATITPQALSRQTLIIDLPVMVALSLACIPIMRSRGVVSRIEGAALLAAWAAYTIAVFTLAPSLAG